MQEYIHKAQEAEVQKENLINEYNEFIMGLHLNAIKASDIVGSTHPGFEPPAALKIDEDVTYKNKKNGFIEITYKINLNAVQQKKSKPGLDISARYKMIYSSKKALNDDVFNEFKNRELRIQIWPYFRELVNHLTFYMGLPPLILDLIKLQFSPAENSNNK